MDYRFSEEQVLFRESIRKFVKNEIIPRAREIGKRDNIPSDLWKKICDFGIIGIVAPEQYGGQPGDSIILGIAAEEIGKGDVSLAATLIPNIGSCLILQNGPARVQKEWIASITRGQKLSCFAVTEPDCGTDAAALKTVAKREGDSYILNGEKTSIGWGMCADVAIVFAKTDPREGAKGVSSFVLPLDFRGIGKSKLENMGLKPVSPASLVFDNVHIPGEHVLGQEGKGFQMMTKALDLMRVLNALISLGAAEAVMEETIEYVKQRVAFGKPIGKFEGVSFKIAEAATLREAARGLCYRSLWLRDQGIRYTKEAAMCKWWSTKVAVEIIHDALLLHGHFGYSAEALIEQRLRDVIGHQLADGTPEGMKLIIVRELLGKEFLPF